MNAGEAMEAGRGLDAMVAEKVMGFRRVVDTSKDYDGTRHGGEFLVSPSVSDEEAFRMLRPRGAVPLWYFVNRDYSTKINDSWCVVEKVCADFPCGFQLYHDGGRWVACFPMPGYAGHEADTAPLAICRAALAALSPSTGGKG